MRTLVINTFLSLDGVMQAPGGPEEDPTGGFAHGGWSVKYWDDEMGRVMDAMLSRPFDLLLGRKTYEIFAAHWPHVNDNVRADRGGTESPADDVAARALNTARKYVASRTRKTVEWQNSTLLEGDVAQAVATLKTQPGPEIQVHGSSNLLQTLIRRGLIDEYRLWTFPLVLGKGKRLFGDGTIPGALRLASSKTSTTGVVLATYEPAGAIDVGSFAFETPTEDEMQRRKRMAET
jgi:dihydrofolate reductase